jgi:zinc protease
LHTIFSLCAWRALATLGAIFASIGAAAAAADFADPADAMQREVLDNGLTLLTLEDPNTPVVSFQMWVKVGSRDERRYTGLAHLFEHMMFKGSENIGPEEHARLVQAWGGKLNAWTSNDFTVYFEDVPPEALPLVIDLEYERVAHLDISEHTLASERQVVLEERRLRSEDDPEGRAYEALFSLLFQAHPYRWPVIGWRSDVEKAPVEACRDFFDTYYVPNNLVIAITGNFDSAAAAERIRATFGRLPRREPVPRNPTEEPAQSGERRALLHFDVQAPLLFAAYHAPKTGHDDAPALDVASAILSVGRASRLYQRLVDREQIALSAEGYYLEMVDAGMFFASAVARPGVPIEKIERSFFAELERLRATPVGAGELAKAKRQLEVDLVNSLATAHALGSRIGRDTAVFDRVIPLSERLEKLRAVTAADVQRVAKTYLDPHQRSVVQMLPTRSEGKR